MGSIKSEGPGWDTNDLGEAVKDGRVSLDDIFHILPSARLPEGPDYQSDPGSLTFYLLERIIMDALQRSDVPRPLGGMMRNWNDSIRRVRVSVDDVSGGMEYRAYKIILSQETWPQGFITGYEGSGHPGPTEFSGVRATDEGTHHCIRRTGWDRDAMIRALGETREAWYRGQSGAITSSRQEGV